MEDGENDDHIVGVRASGVVGMVDEEAVAVFHLIVGVELEDAFDAFGVGAEVWREGGVLTDDVAVAVGDAGGEVVGLSDDGGEPGAEDGGLHLSDDAVEPCADDFLRDDVYLCHGVRPFLLRATIVLRALRQSRVSARSTSA